MRFDPAIRGSKSAACILGEFLSLLWDGGNPFRLNPIHRAPYRKDELAARKCGSRHKAIRTRAPVLIEAKPYFLLSLNFSTISSPAVGASASSTSSKADPRALGINRDTSISVNGSARPQTQRSERGKQPMIVPTRGHTLTLEQRASIERHYIANGNCGMVTLIPSIVHARPRARFSISAELTPLIAVERLLLKRIRQSIRQPELCFQLSVEVRLSCKPWQSTT